MMYELLFSILISQVYGLFIHNFHKKSICTIRNWNKRELYELNLNSKSKTLNKWPLNPFMSTFNKMNQSFLHCINGKRAFRLLLIYQFTVS